MAGKRKLRYKYTIILIAINIIVYLISLIGILTPSSLGINAIAIFKYHQWYRLITNMFSHFGITHLLCNMYALFSFGILIENLIGSKKFITFYILSGTVGSILVAIIDNIFKLNILAAGASGAIFSLLGYMLYASKQLNGPKKSIVTNIVITLIISSLAGGSLMCHISGFVGGLIIAPLVTGKHKSK